MEMPDGRKSGRPQRRYMDVVKEEIVKEVAAGHRMNLHRCSTVAAPTGSSQKIQQQIPKTTKHLCSVRSAAFIVPQQ